jgi:hypothetical protein
MALPGQDDFLGHAPAGLDAAHEGLHCRPGVELTLQRDEGHPVLRHHCLGAAPAGDGHRQVGDGTVACQQVTDSEATQAVAQQRDPAVAPLRHAHELGQPFRRPFLLRFKLRAQECAIQARGAAVHQGRQPIALDLRQVIAPLSDAMEVDKRTRRLLRGIRHELQVAECTPGLAARPFDHPRPSTFGTTFGRSRKASGMPEPSSGRRYMRKASVTSVPLSVMKASSITRVLPATTSSGTSS